MTLVPVDFRIHGVVDCGSVARADSISAISISGIANPRGHQSPRTKDDTEIVKVTFVLWLFQPL